VLVHFDHVPDKVEQFREIKFRNSASLIPNIRVTKVGNICLTDAWKPPGGRAVRQVVAFALARFNHVASVTINANHGIM
jgi:hypothetical protein